MSRTYVIGDIHGSFDQMISALKRIEENPPGTVVFLGDYVDRGPKSAQVIGRLMAGAPNGWKWITLKGNHEDMMVGCIRSPSDLGWWVGNGGDTTLQSFGGKVPENVLEWCDKLPTWHDDGKRVFVHAGVEPKRKMSEQGEAVLLWMRYSPRNADVQYPDRHVVHGHTPELDGAQLYEGRTNLDSGAVFGGNLSVGVFDDNKHGGPIEVWKVSA